MKLSISSLVCLSLLPVAIAYFEVILNDHPNCKGIVIARQRVSLKDGCHTTGVGQAKGGQLLITELQQGEALDEDEENSASNDYTLLFYTSPDCNSTAGDIIASTNANNTCLAIGEEFHRGSPYQSFRIVSEDMSKAGERIGWKADNAALLRHGLTWSDIEGQAKDGEMHGRISVAGGQVFRFHQIGRGMLRGVAIEEWDDNVHVKNDEPLLRDGVVHSDEGWEGFGKSETEGEAEDDSDQVEFFEDL